MKNDDKLTKIDAEQLKIISSNNTKKTNDEIKSYIVLVLILVPIICTMFYIIMNYFYNKSSNINFLISGNKDITAILIVLLGLIFGLFAYIYSFIESHRNNGRSTISITVNNDDFYVNNKMNELLKNLYYKEINYKGGKVYYSFKDRYTMNTASKKRCISYTIKDGVLTIEAWAYMMGRELPIDNKRYGDIVKRALIYDLEYIINNINNDNNEN